MATTSEASRLQKGLYVMRIKLFTVGMLAMLALGACGVGVDDAQGQAAATGQAQQALGLDGKPVGPLDEAPSGAPGTPDWASLPQDPVPIHGPRDLTLRVK